MITKTKEEFLAWLKSLPADTVFCEGLRTHTCPIAKFTKARAWPDNELPQWANDFMNLFDCEPEQNSVATAIRIAEAL